MIVHASGADSSSFETPNGVSGTGVGAEVISVVDPGVGRGLKGPFEGGPVGVPVGLSDGVPVGDPVGVPDGLSVGLPDGLPDGVSDGLSDGLSDGVWVVGPFEGETDGASVVGPFVGAEVTTFSVELSVAVKLLSTFSYSMISLIK